MDIRKIRIEAENGNADALSELGSCHESGTGVARDFEKAIELFDLAVAGGCAQAAYRKANLLYKSSGGPTQGAKIAELLVLAAKADVIPALRSVGYLAMQSPGTRELALDCLRRAASLGDPVSSFNLAWFLPQGPTGAGVQEEAVMWLQQAANAAYPFASSVLAAKRNVIPAQMPKEEDTAFDWKGRFEPFPDGPKPLPTRLCPGS